MMRVILPYIQPGIFAGFFLALTYSLDDFAVTFFVTGNGFSTLSVEIYSMARAGISLTVNAISGLVFFVTVIVVVGYYFITSRASKRTGNSMKQLIQATIAILVVSALLFYAADALSAGGGKSGKDTLTIFNWGEYIDPDLLKQFEKKQAFTSSMKRLIPMKQ